MPCGIIGALTLDGAPPPCAAVERGAIALAHRGPDAHGMFVDDHVVLAHRRLSVIDLATGAQPMSDDASGLTVIFNGEIYNYVELRDRLERDHHVTLRTKSDTEVLLHGYRVWGIDVLQQLTGMFAFAIWDRPRRRLFLAVDHTGQKPLCYYVAAGKVLWFASESKALFAAGIEPVLDEESLILYLMLNYVPQPRSLTRGIRRLPPGHYLEVSTERPEFEPKEYWRVPDAPAARDAVVDGERAKTELQGLLSESLRICLRSDVPLGCFLSGGLDSAAVAALATREAGRPVKAFTVGFEGLADEMPVARAVARHIGAEHVALSIAPRLEQDLDRFAWMLDEPIGDPSLPLTYYVCKAAREHTTVCLTGDGGDELFAGYDYYREHLLAMTASPRGSLAARMAKYAWDRLPARARALVGLSAGNLRAMVRRKVATAERDPIRRHLALISHHYPDGLAAWLRPEFAPALRAWDELGKGWPTEQPLDAVARYDLSVNLPGVLLRKTDIASMAVSLELRCPLLDHHLIEWSRRLAWNLKTNAFQGKLLFRELLRPWLPAVVFEQPKRGFGAPLEQWLRTPAMQREVRARLGDSKTRRCASVLRPERLDRLLSEFYDAGVPGAQKVWSLLMLEQWLRNYNVSLQ